MTVLDRYGPRFARERVPEPWFGCPTTARVFLLTLNPGHVHHDFSDPVRLERSNRACLATLAGKLTDAIHRADTTPSGLRWQRRTYGAFADDPDHVERICNLRLVAYPSVDRRDFSGLPCLVLPSARVMYDFVHGELAPRARRGELALLVMRSAAEWGFGRPGTEGRLEGDLFVAPRSRSVSIVPGSPAGAIVARHLRADR